MPYRGKLRKLAFVSKPFMKEAETVVWVIINDHRSLLLPINGVKRLSSGFNIRIILE